MSDRHVAEIWPSRTALEQELSRRARAQAGAGGGLLLCPPFYTFDTLLPELLAQAPLPKENKPLLPLTGPMLVQGLLRSSDQGVYTGLAAGRRLPIRLWRLLVEIKAAGLDSRDLASLETGDDSRFKALARLLTAYNQALQDRGLADEADQLAALEQMLQRGGKPALLSNWGKLICRRVLWMRTLDIRLIRALGNHIKEVKVEFAITPGWGGLASLQRLVAATEKALLANPRPEFLEIDWTDIRSTGGPLKDLVASYLDPSVPYEGQGADRVEMVMASGRYGLAEELVTRAYKMVKAGVPPHEVALVFPDLDVYGPMVADVARRLKLPVSFSGNMPLERAPLAQAVLALLELPLVNYERQALAAVFSSPYLREPLERVCLGPGGKLPADVGHVLKRSGYLDSRDVELDTWLDRAAAREKDKEQGNKRHAGEYRALAKACAKLNAKLSIIAQHNDIKSYCEAIAGLVRELGPAIPEPAELNGLGDACTSGVAIQVRDHTAKTAFLWTTQDIANSATQAAAHEKMTPGRLLALLREVLHQTPLSRGDGAAAGISVHCIADTMGASPRVILAGGLNQGEFPVRRQGQNLLSSAQRLSLGKKARRPVWRADDEEYEGQLLQMAWLLANCSERVALGAAGSDISGRKQTPSIIMADMANLLELDLPAPHGGVFGELPQLENVLEKTALLGRLSAGLLRPAQSDSILAQAVLWHLSHGSGQRRRWQDWASRGVEEEKRNSLNGLSLDLRTRAGDAFSGRLTSNQALGILRKVLAVPRFRQLSPSALETYAGCPMAWYFNYLLNLKTLSEPGWALQARSEGDWVHRTLAIFFDPDVFSPNWDPPAQAERLEHCLDKAKNDLAGKMASPPAVWDARRGVLLTALKQVVASEMEAMSGALPWKVEEEIGAEFAIEVDEGPPLSLRGRLDRLDHGAQHVVISDYKHTGNQAGLREATDKEQTGISQFQLPVYMAAALDMMDKEIHTLTGRLVPTLLASEKVRKLSYAADDNFFSKDPIIRKQMANEDKPNLFNAIADLWQRLASGLFVALPSQQTCQYCDYRLTCRAQAPSLDLEAKAQE